MQHFSRIDQSPERHGPDPATSRHTAANRSFCYATNYLTDMKKRRYRYRGEHSRSPGRCNRSETDDQAGLGRSRHLVRNLIGDTGYGSAEMLVWLVHDHDIEPHIPVFDKFNRSYGTLSRADFAYDARRDAYDCPGGRVLTAFQRRHGCWTDQPHAESFSRYRASKADCDSCMLKPRCCPNEGARKVMPRTTRAPAIARALYFKMTSGLPVGASAGRSRRCSLTSSVSSGSTGSDYAARTAPRRVPPTRRRPEPPEAALADFNVAGGQRPPNHQRSNAPPYEQTVRSWQKPTFSIASAIVRSAPIGGMLAKGRGTAPRSGEVKGGPGPVIKLALVEPQLMEKAAS